MKRNIFLQRFLIQLIRRNHTNRIHIRRVEFDSLCDLTKKYQRKVLLTRIPSSRIRAFFHSFPCDMSDSLRHSDTQVLLRYPSAQSIRMMSRILDPGLFNRLQFTLQADMPPNLRLLRHIILRRLIDLEVLGQLLILSSGFQTGHSELPALFLQSRLLVLKLLYILVEFFHLLVLLHCLSLQLLVELINGRFVLFQLACVLFLHLEFFFKLSFGLCLFLTLQVLVLLCVLGLEFKDFVFVNFAFIGWVEVFHHCWFIQNSFILSDQSQVVVFGLA